MSITRHAYSQKRVEKLAQHCLCRVMASRIKITSSSHQKETTALPSRCHCRQYPRYKKRDFSHA
jgi:hypothetical protein